MKVFEIGLFSVICVCLVVLIYYRFVNPKAAERQPEPVALDYARSFFPVLALVFVLRSFVAEPFRIPSGSMLSNLEVGDFILVNKFAYGIRLPILHNKVIEMGQPDRGDIVVFRYPDNPDQNYIKRLIGLPGDTVTYDYGLKKLYVNGQVLDKEPDGTYVPFGIDVEHEKFAQTIERSDGSKVRFPILNAPEPKAPEGYRFVGRSGSKSWSVPEGQYFLMGDNRDNSADGRVFGFVPDENIIGKAFFIWMHFGFDRTTEYNGQQIEIPGDGLKLSRIGANITAEPVD